MKRIKVATTIFNNYFKFDFWSEKNSMNDYSDLILIDSKDNQYFIGEKAKNYIYIHHIKDYETVKKQSNPAKNEKLFSISEVDFPYISIPEYIYVKKNITKEEEIKHMQKVNEKALMEDLESKISKNIYGNLKFDEDIHINSDNLNQYDFSLINSWLNDNSDSEEIKSLSDIKMKPYELGRLISARKAEIASIEYLKKFDKDVRDVSITQVKKMNNDWKLYDIKASDTLYDVKNSRHSQMNNDSYTKFEIPKFKAKRMGDEVKILSVLSDYVPSNHEDEYKITKHKILGTASKSSIHKLVTYIDKKFAGLIDLKILKTTRFFPGWIFDYPRNFYESKDISVRLPKNLDIKKLPTWCSIYLLETDFSLDKKFSNEQIEIIKDIEELKKTHNLTRPFIFYYVLGQLLKDIRNKEAYEFKSTFLKDLLFKDIKKKYYAERPLGVYDPLKYIKNLILIFDKYRDTISEENYDSYKLKHPQILCGKKEDESITIIAYCGGWIDMDEKKKPCGNATLVIGENQRCEKCKRLICNECNHCKDNCPLKPHRVEAKKNNQDSQYEQYAEAQ